MTLLFGWEGGMQVIGDLAALGSLFLAQKVGCELVEI